MRRAGQPTHVGATTWRMLAVSLVLALVLSPPALAAQAQAGGPPVDSVVMVSNTGGQRLNLRAGPASDQPIVARLAPGEILTVTGTGRTAGSVIWVPVRTAASQTGWVSAAFIVLLSAPMPAATTLADTAPARASAPAASGSTERVHLSQRNDVKGGPIEVEAKLKFP